MTQICVNQLTIIGSDNGSSPGQRQAIIWINAGVVLIGPLGANFSETLIEIHRFLFKKMHLEMSGEKWPFCLGLDVLTMHNIFWQRPLQRLWCTTAVIKRISVLPIALWIMLARFMGPTWGPSGADRTQVSPMLAPWTLLSGEDWKHLKTELLRNYNKHWQVIFYIESF